MRIIENHRSNDNPIFQSMYSITPTLSTNISTVIESMVPKIITDALSGNVDNSYIFINDSIATGNIKFCKIKYEMYGSIFIGFAIYSKLVKIEFIIKPEINIMKNHRGMIVVLGRVLILKNPINKVKKISVKENVSKFSPLTLKFVKSLYI
jgi:hypothetical protein